MTAGVLQLRGVEKRYGRRVPALRGVDLEVDGGEVVGLLGPNGAGKSTLMKIACGLVRPSGGSAEVCGHPARGIAARAVTGYLAELFRFPPALTPRELLTVHQRLAGSGGGEREREALLGRLHLDRVADRRIGTLSKGTQQRLGIAQALVGAPRLLLLDEPTSALDPVALDVLRDLLAELRDDGVAVLVNSHGLTEVERTCDRIVVLAGGEVRGDGRLDEVLSSTGVVLRTSSGDRHHPGAGPEDVARIVRAAVQAGEDVVGVDVDRATLEDVYRAAVSTVGPHADRLP